MVNGILAAHVHRMIRRFELGHRLSLGENAPRGFFSVVAEAARRVAEANFEGDHPSNERNDG